MNLYYNYRYYLKRTYLIQINNIFRTDLNGVPHEAYRRHEVSGDSRPVGHQPRDGL